MVRFWPIGSILYVVLMISRSYTAVFEPVTLKVPVIIQTATEVQGTKSSGVIASGSGSGTEDVLMDFNICLSNQTIILEFRFMEYLIQPQTTISPFTLVPFYPLNVKAQSTSQFGGPEGCALSGSAL